MTTDGRLILTLRTGESLSIGRDINVRCNNATGRQTSLAIKAPPNIRILRDTITQRGDFDEALKLAAIDDLFAAAMNARDAMIIIDRVLKRSGLNFPTSGLENLIAQLDAALEKAMQ